MALRSRVPHVELDVPVRQRLPGHPRPPGRGTAAGLLLARRALRRRAAGTGRSDERRGVRRDADPEQFQHHAAAQDADAGGIFGDAERTHTRVVDGACIFLNRPGFAGGAGCALHIAALDVDESPTEWKPSVCWQLPLRIDWQEIDADTEAATVRRWTRADWGDHGTKMAWCCTERADGGEAYCGDSRVVESLRDELTALAGESVYVELTRRLR